MAFVHVSVILSGMVPDIADMGKKTRMWPQGPRHKKGFAQASPEPKSLDTDDAEMMQELLQAMGIEGDLANRQFVIWAEEEERTIAFDEEGRMITGEANAS